jgi:DNA-directed RNA polymerase subunit RPC12/RpoP
MSFVAAKCPQCGGDLQLDPEKETGFCMHCGSKIIVQEAIRIVRVDNSHMVDTWMKMGKSALEARNFNEAYGYFTKVVEILPENYLAILFKSQAAGLLSTFEQPRLDEFMYGINASNVLIDDAKLTPQEVIEGKNLFVQAVIDVYDAFTMVVMKKIKDSKFDWLDDKDLMLEIRQYFEKAVKDLQAVLRIIENFKDELSRSNQVKLMKAIAKQCSHVCDPLTYYKDDKKTETFLFGYSASEKERYINLFDDCLIKISAVEPDYGQHDEEVWIDRLSMPSDKAPHYDIDYSMPDFVNETKKMLAYFDVMSTHLNQAREANNAAKYEREAKVTTYKKQKYWEDHPNEYKAYLEEEKRKKEEMEEYNNKMKNEINGKFIQMREIEEKVDELRKEREKLGIFAGSQKKAIDVKVSTLGQEIKDLKNEIERLKRSI